MGATSDLVRYVAKADYSDFPQEVVETTKAFILDTLGVAVAGSSAEGCKDVVDQMLYWGGKPESTIWVFGGKVPSFHAPLANAMMAHARDFDDTHEGIGAHCHVSVLPAALAAAEQRGGVSGRELITAVALGVDLFVRLGQSINLFYSWHSTGILGSYGAAFAAGKILGLSEKQLQNAIGIAHTQTPGCNRQARKDGSLAKRMNPGFAAMGGVLSANLALRGLTGAKAALEGEHGFFNLYKDHGEEFDADQATRRLFDGLGERYEVTNLSFKPYGACRSTHAAIDGALELSRLGQIRPDDIESVTVYASAVTMEKVGTPFEIRTNPQVDAQFSIPYTVAVALLRGKVLLSDFEIDNIKSQELNQLAKKVQCILKPELKGRVPTILEIKTKDGRTLSNTVNVIKGHPSKPLTREERLEKFLSCWDSAANLLPRDNADRLIQAVDRLEEVEEVSQLVEMLT